MINKHWPLFSKLKISDLKERTGLPISILNPFQLSPSYHSTLVRQLGQRYCAYKQLAVFVVLLERIACFQSHCFFVLEL